jgi:hypothetical protein
VDQHRRSGLRLLRAGTTPFQATCIALHEIAHLLLGHHGIATLHDLACWLAPDVDSSLVRTGQYITGVALSADAGFNVVAGG